MKAIYKDSPRRLSTHIEMPAKQTYKYYGSCHPLIHFPTYGKKCTDCGKISHFRGVCRSRRARAINKVEQETVQASAEESSIDLVNINSIHFNNNHSVITENVKTSGSKNSVIVPYKVNTVSLVMVTSCHCAYVKKSYFLGQLMSNWWQQK